MKTSIRKELLFIIIILIPLVVLYGCNNFDEGGSETVMPDQETEWPEEEEYREKNTHKQSPNDEERFTIWKCGEGNAVPFNTQMFGRGSVIRVIDKPQ